MNDQIENSSLFVSYDPVIVRSRSPRTRPHKFLFDWSRINAVAIRAGWHGLIRGSSSIYPGAVVIVGGYFCIGLETARPSDPSEVRVRINPVKRKGKKWQASATTREFCFSIF